MGLFYVHVPFWWAIGLGILLMLGELLVPATVFLWTGISCVVVGAVLYFAPDMPLYATLVLWAAWSLVTVLIAKTFLKYRAEQDRLHPEQAPNQYGADFVGMTAALTADSEHGHTRLNLKGANWGVSLPGGDLKAGSRVKIIGVDGIFLVAEEA